MSKSNSTPEQSAVGNAGVQGIPSTSVVPLRWVGDALGGHLEMLDQRRLPKEVFWHAMHEADDVALGIREMVVRGAPAIGIAAAYGVVVGVRQRVWSSSDELIDQSAEVFQKLERTRPTAVNLFWALERMRQVLRRHRDCSRLELTELLFGEASAIAKEDRANNWRLATLGAELLQEKARVLTHCNTGGLATGGFGTALGIIRAAHHQGKIERIWIDETRPYLQGARLTAWECLEDDLPGVLITDSMAAHFMKEGQVDAVIVGCDRVAANGDVANKIGTYGLAALCHFHGIPFYVAAPLSTIDLSTPSGEAIPIEKRAAREVTDWADKPLAPAGIEVAHPAFDITPANLISAIVTEDGVLYPPYPDALVDLFEKSKSH